MALIDRVLTIARAPKEFSKETANKHRTCTLSALVFVCSYSPERYNNYASLMAPTTKQSAIPVVCLGCGEVTRRSWERRNLKTSASQHTHLVFHDCCQRSDNQHNRGLTRWIQLVVRKRKARKHRFFPKPVGNTAKTSRPRNTLHTTCSCSSFNVAYPRSRAALPAPSSTSPKQTGMPAG